MSASRLNRSAANADLAIKAASGKRLTYRQLTKPKFEALGRRFSGMAGEAPVTILNPRNKFFKY
jgi:hypothetical protein